VSTSVLLVDDHEVVRVGLRSLLDRRDEFHVVGAVATAEEAVVQAALSSPDVVVMDVRLPGKSGIEACREIRSVLPGTRVLMLTSYPDQDAVLASILAGASGYLLKDTTGRDLASAILRIAEGDSLLDPAVTGLVLAKIKAERGLAARGLDERDRRILELMAGGRTNREIGAALHLAEGTVRNLVSRILARLEVGTRSEAAARFTEIAEEVPPAPGPPSPQR
jgi:two-component system, NarL family, response regulator DevR